MLYLLLASIVWSVSFGLFKQHLALVDPNLTAFLRMLLALPLFVPLLKLRNVPLRMLLTLLILGAVQYGIMYSALNFSYRFLTSWQVALFTIFTPLYVLLIDGQLRRQWSRLDLAMGALAVAGALIIQYRGGWLSGAVAGFLLVQLSNMAFAAGQVVYRRIKPSIAKKDSEIFGLLYMGAVVVTAAATSVSGGWGQLLDLRLSQFLVLVYLGILPSGLCFFWWNVGATRVNAATLAVMNNIKIPLAVLASITLFGEPANLTRLLIGGGLMLGAVLITEFRQGGKQL